MKATTTKTMNERLRKSVSAGRPMTSRRGRPLLSGGVWGSQREPTANTAWQIAATVNWSVESGFSNAAGDNRHHDDPAERADEPHACRICRVPGPPGLRSCHRLRGRDARS